MVRYHGMEINPDPDYDAADIEVLASTPPYGLAVLLALIVELLHATGQSVYCAVCTADFDVSIVGPELEAPAEAPPGVGLDAALEDSTDGEAQGHPRTEGAAHGADDGQAPLDDQPGNQSQVAPADDGVLAVRGRSARGRRTRR